MVSSTRQAIAGILVIFSVAVFARAQTLQPKEPTATATVTGKITIKGKPAPGIFVGLRRQESSYPRQLTPFKALTDHEGKYRIENVTAGSYVVVFVAPAYIAEGNVAEKTLIVTKAESIENVDFALVRGGAITGKVVDTEGRPIIEEDVVLLPQGANLRVELNKVQTRTDDRGIYRFFGLPPGRYKVSAGSDNLDFYRSSSRKRVYHPGVDDAAQATVIEVSEGGEATNIDLTLSKTLKTYTASGRIIDGNTGQPMPNVSYSVARYYSERGSSSMSSGARSNARGEFRLQNLLPGKYGVSIQDRIDSEIRAEEVRFEVVDQDLTGLVIKTEKGAVISGVVVVEGADDKTAREQLSKAYVGASVASADVHRSTGSSGIPTPDGSFRITKLPTGTASLHVYSPTARFSIVRIERNGVVHPNTIEIKPGDQIGGIRLVVTYGNASINGAIKVENGSLPTGAIFYVWLVRINDDPLNLGPWSDSNRQVDSRGQFLIEHLPPGTYEISAGLMAPEARMYFHKKQEVVVTSGTTTNVTITLDLSSPVLRP